MSRSSGFVPIRFRVAGRLLLILGLLGLIASGVDVLTGWLAMSASSLYMSLAAIAVGLYLFYIASREKQKDA